MLNESLESAFRSNKSCNSSRLKLSRTDPSESKADGSREVAKSPLLSRL